MRILLIDNYTEHLPNLVKALSRHTVEIVPTKQIQRDSDSGFDAVVISGGSKYEVEENSEAFKEEIDLIHHTDKPVLGVCLGLQLICFAYGCRVIKNKNDREGLARVEKISDDPIFAGLDDEFTCFEHHSWSVKTNANPKMIEVLARSEEGIETVRVKGKMIWGVQFHPEEFSGSDGEKIIDNFLGLAIKTVKKE